MNRRADLLRAAQKNKTVIRFFRPFEIGSMTGYVVDVGPRFFLFAVLDESFACKHYSCLRIADLRQLQIPAKYAAFIEKARRMRQYKAPRKVKIDLSDAASILASMPTDLVTIHREKLHPDVCAIGNLVHVGKDKVSLLEIGPDAVWDAEPTDYRLKEITRIDLPGPYENCLLLVGGSPPKKERA